MRVIGEYININCYTLLEEMLLFYSESLEKDGIKQIFLASKSSSLGFKL